MTNTLEQSSGVGADPTTLAIERLTATMTGALIVRAGVVPVEAQQTNQSPDYESKTVQREFLRRACDQAERLVYKPRTINALHYTAFNEAARKTSEALAQIDPCLTAEHLAPPGYRSDEVRDYRENHTVQAHRIDDLRLTRRQELLDIAKGLIPVLKNQSLPHGLLKVPKHHRQGECVEEEKAKLLCTNACFRMIHEDLAGWTPDEDVLADEMSARHGGIVVKDDEYFKLLQTDAFKEVCDRKITVAEILGADLDTIRKLAANVKTRHPGANVYAIASIGSETAADKDVWHTIILRETDEFGDIIARDPSLTEGSSRKQIYMNRFAERWAITNNRVQMVIAI